jgi:hypothetical protein
MTRSGAEGGRDLGTMVRPAPISDPELVGEVTLRARVAAECGPSRDQQVVKRCESTTSPTSLPTSTAAPFVGTVRYASAPRETASASARCRRHPATASRAPKTRRRPPAPLSSTAQSSFAARSAGTPGCDPRRALVPPTPSEAARGEMFQPAAATLPPRRTGIWHPARHRRRRTGRAARSPGPGRPVRSREAAAPVARRS